MQTSPMFRTRPLRGVIAADAAICAATGILMIAGANLIATVTDLPVALLRIAGLVIVPYVVFLVVLLRQNPIPGKGTIVAIVVNLLWAAGCFAVLTSENVAPTGFGVAFVLIQAAAVIIFAVLEYQWRERE